MDDVTARLNALRIKSGLDDTSWLSSLDEFDEPPLFSRMTDVEFLRDIEPALRGPTVLAWAVDLLEAHCRAVEALPNAPSYFLCLTFQDWELFYRGEQAIPTPSLFVSPSAEKELSRFRVRNAFGRQAGEASRWVAVLGRQDLCVRDGLSRDDEEMLRVYVGYSDRRAFKTLPDYSVVLTP